MKTKTIYSSILSGIIITIFYFMSIKVNNNLKTPLTPLISAFLFSGALQTICILKLSLFTGRAGVFDYKSIKEWLTLFIIWVFNFIGVIIAGSYIFSSDKTINVTLPKQDIHLSVICGILMAVAVLCYQKGGIGKFLTSICVITFIMMDAPHSIVWMARLAISGRMLQDLPYLLIVSIGNLVGGIFVNFLATVRKEEDI